MNINCAFCHRPYALSRMAMLDALQEVDAHQLTHYDAHCPYCRRATQIPRQRLEIAMPNWRDDLKKFEAEMKEHPQHEAPLPAAEAVAEARQAPGAAPLAAAGPITAAAPAEKPAPKAVEEKKPAAKPKAAPKASAPRTSAKAKKPAATPSKGKKATRKK